MKKKFLVLLSILVLSSAINLAYSKPATNAELSNAIRLYKSANYTECYSRLNDIIKKDSTNAVAYYYLGMASTQLGKKDEAIESYTKAISLTTPSSSIYAYAQKGKRCLETPDKCQDSYEATSLDEFITSIKKENESTQVRSDYERLRIENLKREINRSDEVAPEKFKEFKDFSSMNNDVPTNDEIVAAIRTLQKAGLGSLYGSADLSMLTGNSQQAQMINMLGGSSMNPQVIQAMLTNNMSFGF